MKKKKIEKLTSEQKEDLRKFHAEMLAAGLSTQPADRKTAEDAIAEFYKTIGKKPPYFLWCESPATSLMAIFVLKSDLERLYFSKYS